MNMNSYLKPTRINDLKKLYERSKFMILFEDDIFKPYIFESMIYGTIPIIFSRTSITKLKHGPNILIFNDITQLLLECKTIIENENMYHKIQCDNHDWILNNFNDLKKHINANFNLY
jgi:hypothetical protein